jgi:hypothetical protein
MSRGSFSKSPVALRRAELDNPALVPASLLPFKEEYQQIANAQPRGTTLIVLPRGDGPSRRTLEKVATRLRATGRPVSTVVSKLNGIRSV